LTLNRYADPSCIASIGVASTTTLSAAMPGALMVHDGNAFSGFTLSYTNISSSVATLTSAALLLMSSS
jgi:hypothetical protein